MNCQEFIESLGEYLSGELRAGGRRKAERHLKVCAACVNYLRSFEVTIRLGKEALRDETGEMPTELVDVILSAREVTR